MRRGRERFPFSRKCCGGEGKNRDLIMKEKELGKDYRQRKKKKL